MTLDTLTPDPDLDADDFDEETLAALGADGYVFKVWGGDWCIDCKQQLPAFAAALAAAGVPDDRIEHYPVTKAPEGKEGPGVEAYGIDLIPTVVVETPAGEELARFVEDADEPIAAFLARELADVEATV
ncbi:thioredoxin [Halorubrum sp. JWXQ-INN 858]|uniref:thioredoxin n=1 Tax=Halorubrum sp. JWXQ-INN 858 TaxID=2690782 RepID=UPI0013575635|nr:thioredoxin [Halorubrum sp. JWXQ-INN 858]MWV64956.1 thioredoxin [Halorubrum sp. JWXQ-INN 858]